MVRSFTIVHQAAPGVPVPYVSAVVDLDGGGDVKANIVNVEPEPENVSLGMRVQLTTFVAGTDDDGTEAVVFGFEPALSRAEDTVMSDNVWVLGASMTKIGRYPDKDVIDLARRSRRSTRSTTPASPSSTCRSSPPGACSRRAASASSIAKQVGQTGIPIYNVTNACATGATAVRTALMSIKAGEADIGLAVGASRWARWVSSAAARPGEAARKVYEPSGRYGCVMPVEVVLGSGTMPAVFGQAGMEYAYKHDGVGFEQFAKVAREEPRALRR